jgi:tRNA (guanine37-N1)-methyltransferase
MKFDVLTLFPEVIAAYLKEGILGRAVTRDLIHVRLINIRDFANGKHNVTDDRPYGGGDGMVMKPGPIDRALTSVDRVAGTRRVVLLSPQGPRFTQPMAWEMSRWDQIVLVCGRYEGIDERVLATLIDIELSIGDYILSGGELGAMVVIDAVARLVPGVLGGERSSLEDSFEDGLLKYPQYTRPRSFKGMEVPEILLSGDHEKIRIWRRRESLRRTMERRPDLLKQARLTAEDRAILSELQGG